MVSYRILITFLRTFFSSFFSELSTLVYLTLFECMNSSNNSELLILFAAQNILCEMNIQLKWCEILLLELIWFFFFINIFQSTFKYYVWAFWTLCGCISLYLRNCIHLMRTSSIKMLLCIWKHNEEWVYWECHAGGHRLIVHWMARAWYISYYMERLKLDKFHKKKKKERKRENETRTVQNGIFVHSCSVGILRAYNAWYAVCLATVFCLI